MIKSDFMYLWRKWSQPFRKHYNMDCDLIIIITTVKFMTFGTNITDTPLEYFGFVINTVGRFEKKMLKVEPRHTHRRLQNFKWQRGFM